MQVLPLLAGWLAWQGVPEAVRRGRIRLAIAAYAGLLVVALWQALDGRAPADLTLATTGLTALSLAGLAIAARIPLGRPATPRITLGGTR